MGSVCGPLLQQLLLLLLLQLRLMLMLPLLPASLLRADRVLAAICAASDVARGVLPRLVDTSRPGPSFVPFAPSNISSPAVIEALRALKRAALSVGAATTASANFPWLITLRAGDDSGCVDGGSASIKAMREARGWTSAERLACPLPQLPLARAMQPVSGVLVDVLVASIAASDAQRQAP